MLKKSLRPVVRLGQAALAYAQGDYSFDLPEVRGRDEVAVATQSFLLMREAQQIYTRFSNPALVTKIREGKVPKRGEEVKDTQKPHR